MALPKLARGQIWKIDLTPQDYKEEPGKRERPALVFQTDLLNAHGHNTTIIIPGTTDTYQDKDGDGFPLRVPIGAVTGKPTDLLIDQLRAVSNQRFMGRAPLATLERGHMKRVEDAVRIILKL